MADPFDDLEQFRWHHSGNVKEELVETPTSSRLKARKKAKLKAEFFPPFQCLEALGWHRIGPHTLPIMMLLKRWEVMGVDPPYVIGDRLLDALGITSWTRDRALAALEREGLVTVDRHRGRMPRICLTTDTRKEGAA